MKRVLAVILIVCLAVVTVFACSKSAPPDQPILKVNGTVFDMLYFVKMMRLYGVTTSDYAQYVVSMMEENELMRQELEGTYGISIAEYAVDAVLRGMLVPDNATDEEFHDQYKILEANLESYGLSMTDLKELQIRPSLVQEELKKQIGDALYPATDNFEHAQMQALLVTESDSATRLSARWKAGEAFDTLSTGNSVTKYIRDTDNTTIKWVAKGIESTAFDDYTFSENTTLGMISQPILDTDTSDNYWLIKVLAKDTRPLSESDRDTLVSAAFTKWLEETKNSEDNVIVNYLDKKGGTAKLAWALDHVAVSTT